MIKISFPFVIEHFTILQTTYCTELRVNSAASLTLNYNTEQRLCMDEDVAKDLAENDILLIKFLFALFSTTLVSRVN